MRLKWSPNLNKLNDHANGPAVTRIRRKYTRMSLMSPINVKLALGQKRKNNPSWRRSNSNNTGKQPPKPQSPRKRRIQQTQATAELHMPLVPFLSITVIQKMGREYATFPRASASEGRSNKKSQP